MGEGSHQRGVDHGKDAGGQYDSAKRGRRSLDQGQARSPSRPGFLRIAAASWMLLLLLLLLSPALGGVGNGKDIKDMGGAPGSKNRDWAPLAKHPYGHGPYTRCPPPFPRHIPPFHPLPRCHRDFAHPASLSAHILRVKVARQEATPEGHHRRGLSHGRGREKARREHPSSSSQPRPRPGTQKDIPPPRPLHRRHGRRHEQA